MFLGALPAALHSQTNPSSPRMERLALWDLLQCCFGSAPRRAHVAPSHSPRDRAHLFTPLTVPGTDPGTPGGGGPWSRCLVTLGAAGDTRLAECVLLCFFHKRGSLSTSCPHRHRLAELPRALLHPSKRSASAGRRPAERAACRRASQGRRYRGLGGRTRPSLLVVISDTVDLVL